MPWGRPGSYEAIRGKIGHCWRNYPCSVVSFKSPSSSFGKPKAPVPDAVDLESGGSLQTNADWCSEAGGSPTSTLWWLVALLLTAGGLFSMVGCQRPAYSGPGVIEKWVTHSLGGHQVERPPRPAGSTSRTIDYCPSRVAWGLAGMDGHTVEGTYEELLHSTLP